MFYVYTIHDKASGSYYFGSCSNIDKRIKRHYRSLREGRHHNVRLQELFDRGADLYTVHEECPTRKAAYDLEDELIKANRRDPRLLNIGTGARGGDTLTYNPRREAIIAKMVESVRRRYASMSPDERRIACANYGVRNGMYGKHHTAETKRLLSEKQKGKEPVNKGQAMSAERYATHKAAMAKRDMAGEKNGFFGRKHTPEAKAKMAAARLRRAKAKRVLLMQSGENKSE